MNIIERNHVKTRGKGEPVLLYAHGFGCSQDMWSRVVPAFDGSHRQVLFDYAGSGKSKLSAFDKARYATLQGYAQDLIEVADALGLRGVTFVGHSVSCSIGLLASIARPDLFERLILLGPSPCFLNHPPDYLGGFEREDLEGLLALLEQNYIGWANYLAPVVAGAAGAGEVSAELNDSFCSTDPLVAKVFARATFFADNRADLPKVTHPSLILQHGMDNLAPLAVGQYLHQQLANSTLKVLDVAGHCGHLSHPGLVVQAMQEYLATPPV
jgi:sigma-B regulation protein RsbQ